MDQRDRPGDQPDDEGYDDEGFDAFDAIFGAPVDDEGADPAPTVAMSPGAGSEDQRATAPHHDDDTPTAEHPVADVPPTAASSATSAPPEPHAPQDPPTRTESRPEAPQQDEFDSVPTGWWSQDISPADRPKSAGSDRPPARDRRPWGARPAGAPPAAAPHASAPRATTPRGAPSDASPPYGRRAPAGYPSHPAPVGAASPAPRDFPRTSGPGSGSGSGSTARILGVVALLVVALLVGALIMWGLLGLLNDSETAGGETASPTTTSAPDTTSDPTTDGTSPTTPTSTSPSQTRTGQMPAGGTECAGPIEDTSVARGSDVTSCEFAEAVRAAYLADDPDGGEVTLTVRSPVTDTEYEMSCSGAAVTTCTGGNNAVVYLY